MSIPATKLKERFGDSRKRRPNKLETKPSRLHRTLTSDLLGPEDCQTVETTAHFTGRNLCAVLTGVFVRNDHVVVLQ